MKQDVALTDEEKVRALAQVLEVQILPSLVPQFVCTLHAPNNRLYSLGGVAQSATDFAYMTWTDALESLQG